MEEHNSHDREWTISRKNYQSYRTRQKNKSWDRKGYSDDSLETPEKGRESDCTWTGLLVSIMGLKALTNIDTGDDGWFCLCWHFFWNIGPAVRSLKICMVITKVSVCFVLILVTMTCFLDPMRVWKNSSKSVISQFIFSVGCFQSICLKLLVNILLTFACICCIIYICVCVCVCTDFCVDFTLRLAKTASKFPLGGWEPNVDIEGILRKSVECVLPDDAHLRCTNRLFVSVSKLNFWVQNKVISEFETRKDLIDVR